MNRGSSSYLASIAKSRRQSVTYSNSVYELDSLSRKYSLSTAEKVFDKCPYEVPAPVSNWKLGVLCIWSLMIAGIALGIAILIAWISGIDEENGMCRFVFVVTIATLQIRFLSLLPLVKTTLYSSKNSYFIKVR